MINLEKYIVVSGIPGVHKIITTRSNGVIILDKNTNRNRFVAIRQNPVTPLGTIGIYVNTDDGNDTIALGDVFEKMAAQLETNPLPDVNSASNKELRDYFTAILPDHDHDRVRFSDIKKCLKWFDFMNQNDLLNEARQSVSEPAQEEEAGEVKE